ncbi:MAG: PEP/pyruvate-binding domain-containing protein [Desulfobacteraceae bacterium]
MHAYAGLYRTYMLSNDQADRTQRLAHLTQAVKLIYASAYSEGPRAYAKRVGHRLEDDRMAVIIQQVVGLHHGDYYFPTFSGVADSLNYYPMAGMKSEDGTVAVAVGLGKQVVSGERALRFSPKFPRRLIQRTSVEEMLAYSQRRLYALQMGSQSLVGVEDRDNLVRLNIADVEDRLPMHLMAGTYVQAEHRVRETISIPGPRVVTFSGILKHGLFPLAELLQDVLAAAETAMHSAVELEFAVNIAQTPQQSAHFYLLQLRPMAARSAGAEVAIDPDEPRQAICYTEHAMGNVSNLTVKDIVYVKPDAFDSGRTREVAGQLAKINDHLVRRSRTYLLVGPGRWGSADPWLGIPVRWSDISGVAAIVETTSENLKADPSLGAHFFHNLAALGISYLCVTGRGPDHFNWSWVTSHTVARQEQFVAHVRLDRPIEIKVDGRTSRGLIKGNN